MSDSSGITDQGLSKEAPPYILAKVYFHALPEEDDYEVTDEKHISGECVGCVPAYIVPRTYIDETIHLMADLVNAAEEVIRISDRKHDAWDAAKAVIKKLEGDRNQSSIGIGLQFISAKDGKHWPTIGDKYLVRINGVLQNEVFEFDQGDSDFGGGDLYWDHNRDTECPLFNSESDEWLPLASLAAYRQHGGDV